MEVESLFQEISRKRHSKRFTKATKESRSVASESWLQFGGQERHGEWSNLCHHTCTASSKDSPAGNQIQSTLPDHPWERVAVDLFELNGTQYLVIVDYYSGYIEVQKLQSTTSMGMITALKAVFALHGHPLYTCK